MATKSNASVLKACQAAYDLLRDDRQDGALVFVTDPGSADFVEDRLIEACKILRDALGDDLDRYPSKVELARWKG